MIRNELIINAAVADTAEQTETKAPFSDTVTEYQFGKSNLCCKAALQS